MHAFAQGEVGQLDVARDTIEQALEGNPRSAHNAHVSAHIFYEAGDNGAGYRFLKGWWTDYQKRGRNSRSYIMARCPVGISKWRSGNCLADR